MLPVRMVEFPQTAGCDGPQDSIRVLGKAGYTSGRKGHFSTIISKDPFSGFTSLPVSMNRYIYADNNPVNFVDPSGKAVQLGPQFGVDISDTTATSCGLPPTAWTDRDRGPTSSRWAVNDAQAFLVSCTEKKSSEVKTQIFQPCHLRYLVLFQSPSTTR